MSSCSDSFDGFSWNSGLNLNGGTAWASHYDRALLAFEILMVLALIGTFVFSLVPRRHTSTSKKLFICFLFAICVMIFTSTFDFIDRILNEECVRVQTIYLVFREIFVTLSYLADALLLVAIFIYLIPRSAISKHVNGSSRSKLPLLLHLFVCGLLGLWWLIITILDLADVIQLVMQSGLVSNAALHRAVARLEFSYNIIYFLASLEIVILAVIRLKSRSRVPDDEVQASEGRKAPLFFLLLISLPLLIRSIWQLAFAARYTLSDDSSIFYDESLGARVQLAKMLFYYICTALVYFGLAVIMKSLGQGTTFTIANQVEDGDEKTGLSPEIPSMKGPGSVENVPRFDPYTSRGGRISRDHSQDPIYSGP
ncbi:MAG: hypothetical protein Q9215_005881 [Flavoplaca cf. flavocitrina]